jgi:hypothetical protein
MRFLVPGTLLACAVVGLASEARAQDSGFVERQTKSGQDILFDDDPLTALPPSALGTTCRPYLRVRRFDLMRLRPTFVPEMLRSVETL